MLEISLQETRVYQEAKADEAKLLILRQLSRRVGELPASVRSQIEVLPLAQLESLGEALLDFCAIADLDAWLQENQ